MDDDYASLDLEESHFLLLRILDSGTAEKAMKLLKSIVEQWPEFTGKYCGLLASRLAQRGDMEAAVLLYRDAVDFDPEDTLARFFLGVVLRSQGNIEESNQHWRYIEQHHPEKPESFLQSALVNLYDKNIPDARKSIRSARALITEKDPLWRDTQLVAQAIDAVA